MRRGAHLAEGNGPGVHCVDELARHGAVRGLHGCREVRAPVWSGSRRDVREVCKRTCSTLPRFRSNVLLIQARSSALPTKYVPAWDSILRVSRSEYQLERYHGLVVVQG